MVFGLRGANSTAVIKSALVAAMLSFLGCYGSAFAEESVPGHAILAKPGGEALVIWDSTPAIVSIVKNKLSDGDANALLERDAARVLAGMAPNLDKHAKSVTVRVVYSKTGEVNPAYGTPTFAGIERYAAFTMKGADVRSNRDRWKSVDDKSPLPAWFAFKITGLLPPR
jgi:hypothetical protein